MVAAREAKEQLDLAKANLQLILERACETDNNARRAQLCGIATALNSAVNRLASAIDLGENGQLVRAAESIRILNDAIADSEAVA